jgi:hypothetical protein
MRKIVNDSTQTKLLRQAFVVTLSAALSMAVGARALAVTPDVNKAPASGVQWTKIQDLNPNATSTNRPIKQKWAVVIGAAKFKEKRLDGVDAKMDLAARNFAAYLKDPNAGRFP